MKLARLIAALSALLVLSPLIGLVDALLNPPPDPFGMPLPDFSTLLQRSGAMVEVAQLLLDGGADINAVDKVRGG